MVIQNCTSTWETSWVSRVHTRVNVILNAGALDHILSLQQGLAHHERTLGQSHPIYHTQLHIRAVKAKGNSDNAIIVLTVVSIGVLTVQTLIGRYALNAERFYG